MQRMAFERITNAFRKVRPQRPWLQDMSIGWLHFECRTSGNAGEDLKAIQLHSNSESMYI